MCCSFQRFKRASLDGGKKVGAIAYEQMHPKDWIEDEQAQER